MESPVTSDLQTRRIEYERLGASELFVAYVASDAQALKYLSHDPWQTEGRTQAARNSAAHPRDRDLLVDVLLEQNERWWGGEEGAVRDNTEKMRDPDSVTVVTGQQLGLFGGPLYTVYKALTAVRLAEQLEMETGRHRNLEPGCQG